MIGLAVHGHGFMDNFKYFDRRVLVADDDAFHRAFLGRLLSGWQLNVVTVASGQEALEALSAPDAPRLAILDWLMPEVSGVEACQRIKNGALSRYVYVLIFTGGDETLAAQAAYEANADDFLIKPIHSGILRTRLRCAAHMLEHELRLEAEQRSLQDYAAELEKISAQRAEELVKAQHMAALGTMSAGIAHEINNPMAFISANMQTLGRLWQKLEPDLGAHAPGEELSPTRAFALEEVPKMIAGVQNGVKRVTRIIDSLRFYARPEVGRRTLCAPRQLAERAVQDAQSVLHGVEVEITADGDIPKVFINEDTVGQVFVNLITNAAHVLRTAERKRIEVRFEQRAEGVGVTIIDSGPGIPAKILENFGKPFFTTKTAGHGTGLGLYICKTILKQHGTDLTMVNREAGGAEARFVLPVQDAQQTTDEEAPALCQSTC